MENPFARTMRAFGLPTTPERKTLSNADLRPMTVRERFAGKGHDGVDIFIGGGADDWHPILRLGSKGPMRQYAEDYRSETGRPTRYFPNSRPEKVLAAVRQAQRGGGPVNIVGHSWGATDAYNVAARAAREGLRIDNLATLDPVGGNLGVGGVSGREAAGDWTNVKAVPRRRDFVADGAATIGGKPSRVPVGQADSVRNVSATHGNVEVMMKRGGVRRRLDLSRAMPRVEELHDGLTTPEWMRRRSAQKPTSRTWP